MGQNRLFVSKYKDNCSLNRYPQDSCHLLIMVKKLYLNKGWFKKNELMEFSFKLAGWVLDDPGFHYKKGKKCS